MMSLNAERAGAAALDAGKLALERARGERIAQRDLQALGADRLDHEIGRARAHRRDHIVDAAMRGLHDHRNRMPRSRILREHAKTVEIGHDQIEHDGIDGRAVSSVRQRDRGIAAFGDARLVAELAHHVVERAAAARDRHRRSGYAHSLANSLY